MQGGRTTFAIRDFYGEVVAEHLRVDLPGGGKRMYWRRPGMSPEDGLGGLSPADLPLYGSELIGRFSTGQTVILTEGERARDALHDLGFAALATVTGASSCPNEDALSPLLPFDLVLWPDHDRAGYTHMNRVAWAFWRLSGHLPRAITPARPLEDGRQISLLVPKGFDAADLAPRANRRRIVERLIALAQTWDLHPEQPTPIRPPRPRYGTSVIDRDRTAAAREKLVDVVTDALGAPLKRTSRSLFWRCPFHTDKSPSFKVDLFEPFYRCFGCEARGDVFTFLAQLESLPFKDVLGQLAPPQALGAIRRYWA